MPLSYQVIIIGGTGAVGSALIRELLASPRCTAITLLTRRLAALNFPTHPKLTQKVISMEELEQHAAKEAIGCTVAFCTLGAGQPSKLSKEELWKIDVDYVAAFGRGCRTAGVQHISLLSAAYANPNSRFYFSRVKGNAEIALTSLGFNRTSLFRPALLMTPTVRYGWRDYLLRAFFPHFSSLLPQNLHEISVEDLARGMFHNVERLNHTGTEILNYPDIISLLKK